MSRWRTYHLAEPPPVLHRSTIQLDNVALVPGNLLPFKSQWQELVNQLPSGSVLICLPPNDGPQRRALKTVAELLAADGHHVTTLPAERFQRKAKPSLV